MSELNTSEQETTPFISPDGLALYYAARRGADRDLYVSRRASRGEPWGPEARIEEVTTDTEESGPSVTADGLSLFFLSRRSGEPKIYVATRTNVAEPWSAPELVAELDGPEDEDEPSISPDGLTMVFGRLTPSGDLFIATRPGTSSPFGPPEPITAINTDAHEFDPWISADGRILLYGTSVSGDQEIWMATR